METRTFWPTRLALVPGLFFLTTATPSLLANPLAEQLTLAEKSRDWPAAVEITTRLLADRPDDQDLLVKLARFQRQSSDRERAARTLQRVTELAGEAGPAVLEIRGDLAADIGELDQALSSYQLALRSAPGSVSVLDKLAGLHVRRGEIESAAIYFEKLTGLRDDTGDHLNLAYSAVRHRDWSAVASHLAAAMDFSTNRRLDISKFENLLGRAVQLGRHDRAIKADPKNLAALLDRAQLFYDTGFADLALEDAQRAARIDGRSPHVRLLLARYYVANGDREKPAELKVNRRSMRNRSEEFPTFIRELTKLDGSIRKQPDDLALRHLRAALLMENGQLPLALEDIDHSLASDPGSVRTRLQKIRALEMSGERGEARRMTRALAEEHPGHDEVLQRIGEIQMQDGLYREAIATFDKILAKRPGYAPARDSRTLCHKRLQVQDAS